MRNLKKVLSMVLAVSMMLSMMVFAGAAETKTETAPEKPITSADLIDMDKVVNKDAVSLLVDLGVIAGIKNADGTFSYKPQDSINRASYSKMIFKLMLANADESVYKGTNTGLKDVANHWGEGFIAYCVSTKIAAGDTDKNFKPDSEITTVAAAKMLLTALGYNSVLSGYQNDDLWSINIMRDAQKAGILDGVTQDGAEVLNRDNAAQMIYNALGAQKVLPKVQYDNGIKYLDYYMNDGGKLGEDTYKLVKVTGVLTGNEANTAGVGMVGKSTVLTTEGSINYDVASKLGDLGHTVTFYAKLKSMIKMGATPSVPEHFNVALSNIDKVYSKTVVASKDDKVVAVPAGLVDNDPGDKDSVEKFLSKNGLKQLDLIADKKFSNYRYDNTAAIAIADLGGLKNADVAFIIDNNGDGEVDVLSVATKSIAKLGADPKIKTDSDGKITVQINGVNGSYEKVNGYEGLKKGDYVMHIMVGDTRTITKCTTLEGQLTGVKGAGTTGTLYIDKVGYKISSIRMGSRATVENYTSAIDYGKDATFMLDENKNLVYGEQNEASKKYETAVILGYDRNSGTTTTYDTVGVAKLLFSDGTTEVVDVTSYKDSTGASLAGGSISGIVYGTATLDTSFGFVTYNVDTDGNYELTQVKSGKTGKVGSTDYATVATDNKSITPGVALFDGTNRGDNKTTFIVVEYKEAKAGAKVTGYKTYTGIANAPKFTATDAVTSVLTADGVANLVMITAGAQQSVGKDSVFAYIPHDAAGQYDGTTKTFTWDAYISGTEAKTSIEVKKDVNVAIDTLYKIELDENKVVIAATAQLFSGATHSTGTRNGLGVSYSGGVITINDLDGNDVKGYYTLDTDALVYVISADGKEVTSINAADIEKDKTDTILVAGEKISAPDLKATTVYIQKMDSAAVAPVAVKGTVTAKVGGAKVETVGVDASTGAGTEASPYAYTLAASGKAGDAFALSVTAADQATVSITSSIVVVPTAANATNDHVKFSVTSENGKVVKYYDVAITFTVNP